MDLNNLRELNKKFKEVKADSLEFYSLLLKLHEHNFENLNKQISIFKEISGFEDVELWCVDKIKTLENKRNDLIIKINEAKKNISDLEGGLLKSWKDLY